MLELSAGSHSQFCKFTRLLCRILCLSTLETPASLQMPLKRTQSVIFSDENQQNPAGGFPPKTVYSTGPTDRMGTPSMPGTFTAAIMSINSNGVSPPTRTRPVTRFDGNQTSGRLTSRKERRNPLGILPNARTSATWTTGLQPHPHALMGRCSTTPLLDPAVPAVGRPIVKPPMLTPSVPRQSSPLGPVRRSLPCRPSFPRSRPEPSLYQKALRQARLRAQKDARYVRKVNEHANASMLED